MEAITMTMESGEQVEMHVEAIGNGRQSIVEKQPLHKRKKARECRVRGEEYTGYQRERSGKVTQNVSKEKKVMKPRCSHGDGSTMSSQGFRCGLVSDEARSHQFEQFWAIGTWESKKVFVQTMVDTRSAKRRRVGQTAQSSRKQECHDCYLKSGQGTKVRVCRQMFLGTLSLGEDQFRRWTQREVECSGSNHLNRTKLSTGNRDAERGVAGQIHKSRKDPRRAEVKEWLALLPKVPSRYCRASWKKIYLESTFRSQLHMYDVYSAYVKEKHGQPVSRMTFLGVVEEENVAIHAPRKDQCDTCFSFKSGNVDSGLYDMHLAMKNEARDAKKAARALCSPSTIVVTMDLQSVFLCPRIEASAVYYRMKLQLHNFTIYRLNEGDVHMYVWHECNGSVTANEFSSCIVDYIAGLPQDTEHVILISDGCGHQNRNRVLSSALSQLAKAKGITIEQLILEKGHTMMEVDSVHATLEHMWDKQSVCAPSDYLCFMRQARKKQPYIVKSVDYTFFEDFEHLPTNLNSIQPGITNGDPDVSDIRGLKYEPSGEIKYRLRHSEEWNILPGRSLHGPGDATPAKLYTAPLKVSAQKFKHLQELKQLLPPDYHSFYDNLPHN